MPLNTFNKILPSLPSTFTLEEANGMDKGILAGALTCIACTTLSCLGLYIIGRKKSKENKKVDYLAGSIMLGVGIPGALVSYNASTLLKNIQTFARNEEQYSLPIKEVIEEKWFYDEAPLMKLLTKGTFGFNSVCNFTSEVFAAKKLKTIANSNLFDLQKAHIGDLLFQKTGLNHLSKI